MARSPLKNVLRLIDDAKNEVPVEKAFLQDLKRSIEMDSDKDRRLPSLSYKPSSMNCIRNMYYQVTGHAQDEIKSNYTLVGICNSGTDIHKRIQDAVLNMHNNGIDCEYVDVAKFVENRHLDYLTIVQRPEPENGLYETKLFYEDLKLSFLCDGIIRYKGKYYILELKTESNYKWQNRQDVDSKHYAQGTAYSIAFGLNEVIFIYITRDVLDMKAFMFKPTDEMKAELIDKIKTCESYVNEHSCPPKPNNLSRLTCEYCNYRDACNINAN